MLRFHHVNLGVPVGGADAEAAFLVDFLAYQRVELTADVPPTARWFESEDGKQIHLSEAALERKFEQAGYQYTGADGEDRRTVLCQDPAGNRWELRGTLGTKYE